MYIKELCSLDGVSGCENEVRSFIIEKIRPLADELTVDSIGNIIALKHGERRDKRVMLSAHTDEVGFIISGITDNGFLEFKTVGGIDTRVIISKHVRIGRNKINGIIGIKAIHLQTRDERRSVPKLSSLYIDIGAKSREEAEKLVSLGDYAAFDTRYSDFGTNKIKAKAIDDRVGCAILIELMREKPLFDTYFCFMAQEEVGLRGAGLAAARVKPDIALVLEATTCSDVGGVSEADYVTRLGGGAAVSFADRTTVVERGFCEWLINSARKESIPVQYKASVSGGNDAGAIHLANGGIKTASVSVPCRYIHSSVGIADKSDIEAVKALALLFLKRTADIID